MRQPIWIGDSLALAIHARQIAEHGGEDGLRDATLLSSALARARNVYEYEQDTADVARLAAAYLIGLTKNHPFVDGNKRVAAVVCETFINLNGASFSASDAEFYDVVIAAARGELAEDGVAGWLRGRVREVE